MTELPGGTVTLLFSDIEGSTVLLSRLGAAYGDALDEHRRVLRAAWAEHGGTELGTEGDSFFVAYPTAEGAVAAAAQAQRDLTAFEWPGGEAVRVRIGIHTGTPAVRGEGYVGMDVHRAARIAGAAHGGQVVMSSACAGLVSGCLPQGAVLRDLGSHHLKDIPTPEHLFDLVITGAPAEFPPPRTLGAASSLPRPPTPLVGREGELAELTELVGSAGARLVTLTGPGGSGKTRLAVGVAEGVVEHFPDGIYFVSLAAVTGPEAMWTSIAEVLDVPPQGRTPPGLFEHVVGRTALFVLDNLEQVEGAEEVVGELLEGAPRVVVIATSRRPLHLIGEFEHPVPPLELPPTATLAEAEGSGAVQLFVQHARRVRPGFALTAQNAADVVAVCRRLDGLPLAIELAAARVKVLSPKALLPRLDQALDLAAATTRGRPTRQKTLRDTIAWSYDLLPELQQAFFRRLGAFAGGADLDAIAAVTADVLDGADPLDLVGDLLDASLVTIPDNPDGEPRVMVLETIRDYAEDLMRAVGEHDQVHQAHAAHYLRISERLRPLTEGSIDDVVEAGHGFEVDHDNFREALHWLLPPTASGEPRLDERTAMGLTMCANLGEVWRQGGYYSEARAWLERAAQASPEASTLTSTHVGHVQLALGRTLLMQGQFGPALAAAEQADQAFRRTGDDTGLASALEVIGQIALLAGDSDRARACLEEAMTTARQAGADRALALAMSDLAYLVASEGDLQRSLELDLEVGDIFRRLGDEYNETQALHNAACSLRELGRPGEALGRMISLVERMLRVADPEKLTACAEDLAALFAALSEHALAVRLLGAADAVRNRNGTPRPGLQEAAIAGPLAAARAALSVEAYEHEYRGGQATTIEDALAQAIPAARDLHV